MVEKIGDPIKLPDGTAIPISQAVRANGFLFVSGQLGVKADFSLAGEDVESQTAQALENLKAQLKAGGTDVAHVVKVTAWITDPSDFAGFNKIYAGTFGASPPARSTVVSGLLLPGAKIEIEAVAALP